MEPLRVFKSLLAFLTAIPLKVDQDFLQISARFMFLFPLIGALIGFFAGLYSYSAYFVLSLVLGSLNNWLFLGRSVLLSSLITKGLASVMTLAFLLVLTGLQHTDGLVDLGNALTMRKASVEDRTKIAHAWVVTRSGAFLALLVTLGTVIALFFIPNQNIVYSLIVAEIAAKIALVTCAWQGNPAQKGLGSIFIDSMRHQHKLFLISLATSLVIGAFLQGFVGILVIVSGIVVGGLAIFLGRRVFGGVTGDIFGATNEIARMTALFVLALLMYVQL